MVCSRTLMSPAAMQISTLFFMLRPSITTFLLLFSAASMTLAMRVMWDANMLITRRFFFFCRRYPDNMVKFVIAGRYDVAVRCFDDNAHGIGYRVRYAEKADMKASNCYAIVPLDDPHVYRGKVRKLFLTFFYHERSKISRVHRWISNTGHEIGNAADVVKVAMRDKDRADFMRAFFKVARVRKDKVYARSFLIVELQSHVYHHDVASEFNNGHVAADFLNAAKTYDSDAIFLKRRHRNRF